MIVVIPSNRAVHIKYLSPLIDHGARFIVVDDTEGCIQLNHPQFEVYTWGDRRRMLGPLDSAFPRRNGASRDFGFYVAWKNSDPGEIIVALDDDCRVYHHDFATRVEDVLSNRPRPVATCAGAHLNILNLYQDVPVNLFPRGYPYSYRSACSEAVIGPEQSGNVTFCLGLWKGVFDVNGIDKIQGPDFEYPDAELKTPSVIVERGRLISVCSMNMQFRREMIPAVYQFPMHVPVMENWVIDRYGDIWGGFVLKTLMDVAGDAMAIGEPMIHHIKKDNYLRNIWQEHIAHLVNDEFLNLLAEIKEGLRPGNYLGLMQELNEGFKCRTEQTSPLLRPYLRHLCSCIDGWCASLS